MALAVLLSILIFSYSVPTRQRSRGFPALWKNASSSSFFSMTDMVANILLIRRMDHSLFSDNRRNQVLGGYVKGRIQYLCAFGRQRPTEDMRHLFGVPLFDGDVLSRRAIKIDR